MAHKKDGEGGGNTLGWAVHDTIMYCDIHRASYY